MAGTPIATLWLWGRKPCLKDGRGEKQKMPDLQIILQSLHLSPGLPTSGLECERIKPDVINHCTYNQRKFLSNFPKQYIDSIEKQLTLPSSYWDQKGGEQYLTMWLAWPQKLYGQLQSTDASRIVAHKGRIIVTEEVWTFPVPTVQHQSLQIPHKYLTVQSQHLSNILWLVLFRPTSLPLLLKINPFIHIKLSFQSTGRMNYKKNIQPHCSQLANWLPRVTSVWSSWLLLHLAVANWLPRVTSIGVLDYYYTCLWRCLMALQVCYLSHSVVWRWWKGHPKHPLGAREWQDIGWKVFLI